MFIILPTFLRYAVPLFLLPFLVHFFSDRHTNIFRLCFLKALPVCLLFEFISRLFNKFFVGLDLLFLFCRLYDIYNLVEAWQMQIRLKPSVEEVFIRIDISVELLLRFGVC